MKLLQELVPRRFATVKQSSIAKALSILGDKGDALADTGPFGRGGCMRGGIRISGGRCNKEFKSLGIDVTSTQRLAPIQRRSSTRSLGSSPPCCSSTMSTTPTRSRG